MSSYRVEPWRCPDCGRFVVDVGVHECPGPAVCRCGRDSNEHLVETTKGGRAKWGAIPGVCTGFRRVPR